jgi:hypothetical protein
MKYLLGNTVNTPRFDNVLIEEVFDSDEAARKAGYTEPTHSKPDADGYVIRGRSLDFGVYMTFAAVWTGGIY